MKYGTKICYGISYRTGPKACLKKKKNIVIQPTETFSFSQGLESQQQLKNYGKFFYDTLTIDV